MFRKWLRQLFCWHDFKFESSDRYAVVRRDDSLEGTVKITVLRCRKCEADYHEIGERIHYPRPKPDKS